MYFVFDGKGATPKAVIGGIELLRGFAYEVVGNKQNELQLSREDYETIKDKSCIHEVDNKGSYSYKDLDENKTIKKKVENIELFEKSKKKEVDINV